MLCRRCGADIADGSDMCPLCGISQKTYINPRNYDNVVHVKKKRSRGTVISMISMIVAVAAVFGMIYLSGKETEKADYEKVVNAYNAGDEELLVLVVGQYMKNHPKSDRVDEVQTYLNKLRGIEEDNNLIDEEPGGAEAAAERVRQAEIERLTPIAAKSILQIDSVVLGDIAYDTSRSLTIYWRNMSDKTVKEILFKVYAYDADDIEIDCDNRSAPDVAARANNEYAPNPTGDVYKSLWLKAWYGKYIDHIKIKSVRIVYDDDSVQILPEEIVELVTGLST